MMVLASQAAWASVPAIVFAALSVLALLAGALAVVRATYVRAQIEGLRGDRDDLLARLAETRQEAADSKADVVELEGKLVVEIKKREVLEQVVTGKRELEAVLSALRTHDERAQRIERKLDMALPASKRGEDRERRTG